MMDIPMTKITYNISAKLNPDQIYALLKESIEKKTGKELCNVYWSAIEGRVSCELIFRSEAVDFE